ncbi:eyes absent homolog 3 isoform X1 [Gallus gallus]|uniref:Eyes absent homolog n=3 Tax=Gallus gallus TaxID=9031 RepID=A0A8V0YAP9_CHICK|nr:eyes absent homolog 3 isoform X1 [Gallus gallus]XP_046759479.1 eyes absent homolog 3 isoform X1 [Gallus gallus]XP_046759480.1 eyes absent homolog 3 isoform X1 [Gallus gallus]XP_046759481.1 eyes absent homolog 3 isoform X1 [Gallus gallus]XP_046787792.1 eyes absent homolog 3 isoform X1 [Gallus gallus]XP_046787793.1 eyes absent homolog 3 isoform X1 [Gallus gallus]XP_046787794.1 eyes absent homolog 3 isoform X1 [Gallus gallus]XP_046787795.1 eyes absent homolog 3 isoform X1 [Gallus gallus]|eukprot:XP_015153006.1 eyes absent homolog 3 isoform X1 [Gallus gallus]
MEEPQDLPEQPVKKAKMQESREQSLSSHVSNTEVSDQKAESSSLGSNLPMSTEIMTCTDYIPRSSNDYTSQMYSAKPYAHILSVPVSETMSPYPGQTQYQALQQSQPYTIYPQTTQTYGLPPFGALWPGMKPESGLIQTPSTSQHSVLTCTTGLTTSQPSPAHYSYSIEASTTNASPVSTSSTVVNISTSAVASISQEYPTYTILGQSQYQTCYPSSGFGVITPADSNAESTALATATYPSEKPNAMVPTRTVQRHSSGDASTSPSLSRATASKESDEQARKNIPGKNRGKRKADTSSSQDSELERVFLWDLDETIIIFHSLLTGSYAQKYGKDPTLVIGSGLSMEEMIFEVADTHLFFNDLEECDQVHIEDVASDDNGQDLSNYNFSTDGFSGSGSNANHSSSVGVQGGVDWMRKLAFRYRRVREIYDKYKTNVGGLLSPQKREALQRLRTDIEVLTDSWLETALKSLLLIQSRKNCVNILITTTQLVPALAKVLLYGLGEVFPIENIYSATKIGKESCFERIVSRFGKKVTYVVIGDGRDEEVAAKQHNMPFWRITNHADLVSLHQALELDFL